MKRSGQFTQVTVWLMLLGFLCCMVAPSTGYAKIHRRVDTEGDPGDGMDSRGSGSGTAAGGGTGEVVASHRAGGHVEFSQLRLVPEYKNGELMFRIEVDCRECMR